MIKCWKDTCFNIQNTIYTYLEFFELKNIEVVHRDFIPKSTIKKNIRLFIQQKILQKNMDNYYLQIYYQRTKYRWDYINICSCKNIYTYKKIKKNPVLNSTGDQMNTQENIIIYNKYTKKCYIQSSQNFI